MYYAFMRAPMINSKGEDTSILFGFTKFLLELLNKEHPTHIAVAFDPPAKTFRHEMYPEYKANRSAAPELVKEALEPLTEIVKALGIPVVMRPGYEADDVIGSIAKQFAAKGYNIYMVTPDKDLGQIIDDNIFQYKPGKGKEEKSILGKAEICEHYGIDTPSQVIDILTLWGDTADNVRGVNGVGEVSAKKLIGKYGSVENIYAHISELTPKMQEAFNLARGYINQSKALVTIKTDIELNLTEEELKNNAVCNQCITDILTRYEMPSLIKMLPQVDENQEIEITSRKKIVAIETTPEEIERIAIERGIIAFRKEKSSVVLAYEEKYSVLQETDAALQRILADENVAKIGHNVKPSIVDLKSKGISVNGKLQDIEIMHYLLNPERTHKLDILASGYLDVDITVVNEGQSAPAIVMDLFSAPIEAGNPDEKILQRTINESVVLTAIYQKLHDELAAQNIISLYDEIEEPLINVLADMEHNGVKIDPYQLNQYSKSLSEELNKIEREAREMVGEPDLNLSSVRQVGDVIYEKLNLNPKAKKNAKSNYPTDEETLNELYDKHPFVGKVLEFRAAKKLLSTYIDPLPSLVNPESGKIHTTFNQALTATGRLSSVKPNLQNIPIRTERGREIRKAFVPSSPDGYIVSADYSQIELRIMAELSRDESLVDGFIHNADIHTATAAKIFKEKPENVTKEQRRQAKTANFGIIYGISAFGLSQRLNISRAESKKLIEDYFINYPKVKEYMNNAISKARDAGYVQTIFGRKRYLPDINSRNQVVRGLSERNAINAPIQGSAADIIKLAMIRVDQRMKREGLESKMVLQVHDELVFDVIPAELDSLMRLVKEEMESVCNLSVPLTVECSNGKNWLEAH